MTDNVCVNTHQDRFLKYCNPVYVGIEQSESFCVPQRE